ncbi:MAG: hypothetical protein Q9187_000532 [Circinaria calcarea]
MANRSLRSEIISSKPIGEGLKAFRDSLNPAWDPDRAHQSGNQDFKNRVVDLLLALQNLPAARLIPSNTRPGTLFGDLQLLGSSVDTDNFEIQPLIRLFKAVLNNEPDEDIWNKVSAAVTESTPPPRPTVFDKLLADTPLRSTSSSQQSHEQTHKEIDRRILQEIDGCFYKNTKGFYERYFEGKEWSEIAEKIMEDVDPQFVNNHWTGYPLVPTQAAVLALLKEFQETFFHGHRGKYYTSKDIPLGGSDCDRKPDLFLALSGSPNSKGIHDWSDVRVVGELKQSQIQGKFRGELLQFCGYAREVFVSQPARRFLHGFFIRGDSMELWVFDRSGPYGSEKFCIRKDPHRFIKIMAGYTLMNDEELGINTYIKEDKSGKYIMFKVDDKTVEEKLYLEYKPIAFQRAIVCRGTTCYRVKIPSSNRWEHVAKFSWRLDQRRAEGELLKLARERNMYGITKLFSHQDLESIKDLRRGLQFGEPQMFQSSRKVSTSQSYSRRGSSLQSNASGISSNTPTSSSSR